jgi:aspartate dehydrogenase
MNIGIIGAGTIGEFLISELKSDPSFKLVAVADIDSERAKSVLTANGYPESLLMPMEKFPENTGVYIEAASGSIAGSVARYALEKGKIAIIASIGGLGEIGEYRTIAERTGGRLILPSGAIAGLDALKAIPASSVHEVLLTTTKPSKTLADTPWLIENGIDTLSFTEPTLIFSGSAREAAKVFPKSINVAAALAHATIGLDKTMVEIWADPAGDRNRHEIRVESGHGILIMEVSNVPFEANPRTSRLAAYSILATVRGLTRPVIIGT